MALSANQKSTLTKADDFPSISLGKYKGVCNNIGMFKTSLSENNMNFNFESGVVDFWDFAQALKTNIDMNIAEGNHLVFQRQGSTSSMTHRQAAACLHRDCRSFVRIAEDRIREGKQDRFDINVSSIGQYPFATEHKNSGIKMNGQWTNGSGKCYVKLLLSQKFRR